MVLELLEAKLDEGLSYLEGDNPERARQELAIRREFGSVQAFVEESMKASAKAPEMPDLS